MKTDSSTEAISEALSERVLAKLGFPARPLADRTGLAALYGAWCRGVPFDNTRKLIALRGNDSGPLPGDSASDFLASWLEDGAGGTCWAMHGAWTELLTACGFRARRGIATMLVAPDLPPNHGTTSVDLAGETLLVDACMQHGEPLVLDAHRETVITHPAHGVRARPDGAKWLVRWRSPFAPGGMDCRIDSLAGDADQFRAYHETTRSWSPFNFQLFVRLHHADGILAAVQGERVFVDRNGIETRGPLEGAARISFLVEEVGLRESLAARVPADVPMPPPPGSRQAAAGGVPAAGLAD